MSLVVSLTTIPPRFPYLMQSLPHLLAQTAKIDEIRLYVPKTYRRFPDYDGTLPEVPKGIRLIQPDEDLGPASKVLFAADDLKGTDCDIIYCDDDRAYDADWFARMLAARGSDDRRCVATSTLDSDLARRGVAFKSGIRENLQPVPFCKDFHYRLMRVGQILRRFSTRHPEGNGENPRFMKPGFAAIAEGFGAVLVKPDFYDAAVYDIPPIVWSVDDVWLSGHMARLGIQVWQPTGFADPPTTDGSETSPLYKLSVEGVNRDKANLACIAYMQKTYGIWV